MKENNNFKNGKHSHSFSYVTITTILYIILLHFCPHDSMILILIILEHDIYVYRIISIDQTKNNIKSIWSV